MNDNNFVVNHILDHNFAGGGSDYADQGWRSSQQDSPNLEEDLA